MTYFSSPPAAFAHDRRRRHRPRTLGQEHRRIRAGQEPAPAFRPRRQQGARAGRAISPRPRASNCPPISSEAVADPRVQAVFLATPHSLHVEQISRGGGGRQAGLVREAAGADARRSRARGRRLRARPACRSRSATTSAAFRRCANSSAWWPTARSARCCTSKAISPTSTRRACSGGWRDDPNESPGGGMTGAGLHVIDAFVNLAGPIAKVDARAVRAEAAARSARCRRRAGANSPAAPPACWRPCAPRRCIGASMCSAPRAGPRRATRPRSPSPRSASSRTRKSSRRSIRSACCWRPSPRPSRPASRFRSRPPRCSTSSAPSRRSSARWRRASR